MLKIQLYYNKLPRNAGAFVAISCRGTRERLSAVSYLGRCPVEVFLEHSPEKFIIGKPVPLQNLLQGIFGGDQIMVNMGQTDFVLVF